MSPSLKSILSVFFLSALLSGCSEEADSNKDLADTQSNTQSTGGDDDTSSSSDLETDTGPEELLGFEITDRVELETSLGKIVLALFGNDAPITTNNFLMYIDEGFFDGLIFHRVIPDFMIQGGGYNEFLDAPQTHDPIPLEIVQGLSHQPGVISMARAEDPVSATSQFFICVADNVRLDGNYAAFGATLEGYDVVEAISLVKTRTKGIFENVPVVPVLIESAKRL
jgi:cyclophilin family peptidyl-prolyl cis-trans isomerase